MFFKRILAFTLLAALLPLSTAQAEVKWPYVLDTDFSDNGYDTQAASGAQKLAMDGEDTIVAVTTTVSGSDEVDVELLRYNASGQLKPWNGFSGSPTHLPILGPSILLASILAVRDIKVDHHGDIHLLLDVRANGKTNSDVWMQSVQSNGELRGINQVYVASSNQTGGQILAENDRLYILATGAGFIQLSAWTLNEGAPPALDTSWGSSGRQSHTLLLCGTPALPLICSVKPQHLARIPRPFTIPPSAPGGFYIGGSVKLTRNTPASYDLFLLKLDANGARVTSFANNGLATWGTENDEHMAGMQLLLTGQLLLGTHDVLTLSAIERACGEGIIVYRRSSSDGSQISRTFTHGGSATEPACDSIQARDMVLTRGNRLAVAGTYRSAGLLSKDAAMLLTFNPDTLNDSQDVQTLLGGGSGPVAPSYGFNAIARHPTRNRLMAVGNGSQYTLGAGWRGVALISALKEKPLFSDGFED